MGVGNEVSIGVGAQRQRWVREGAWRWRPTDGGVKEVDVAGEQRSGVIAAKIGCRVVRSGWSSGDGVGKGRRETEGEGKKVGCGGAERDSGRVDGGQHGCHGGCGWDRRGADLVGDRVENPVGARWGEVKERGEGGTEQERVNRGTRKRAGEREEGDGGRVKLWNHCSGVEGLMLRVRRSAVDEVTDGGRISWKSKQVREPMGSVGDFVGGVVAEWDRRLNEGSRWRSREVMR